MISPEIMHYLAAIISIGLGALGAGVGLGIAGFGVQESMTRQPSGNAECSHILVLGLALIESGSIVALVTTLLILSGGVGVITFEYALAELGIGLGVGVAAATISIASSLVVKATAQSIARQPFFAPKVLPFMLISQSIIEAPVIFAFIVALMVRAKLSVDMNIFESVKLFSAGLVMALGCIGPSIGQAIFTYAACTSIGLNKNAYNKIFTYALINEAIIETAMIFCMLLAILIVYTPLSPTAPFVSAAKFLTAAVTLGVGAFGSAIGIGYAASRSCYQIALDPDVYAPIMRTNLLAVAFIESVMIYALVVALLLIR